MELSRRFKLLRDDYLAGVIESLLDVSQQLGFKLFLIAVGISLTSVVASSLLILSLQRQHLIEDARNAIAPLSDLIAAGLDHAMLDNDWGVVNTIIQNQVDTQFLKRIRILDDQNVIRASSDPAEIGQAIDIQSPACQHCHEDLAASDSRSGLLTQSGDQHVFMGVNPIENRAECHRCHAPENELLGLLLIEKPVTELNSELWKAFGRILTADLVTFVLLLAMLWWAAKRIVLEPVNAINQGVAAISAGDLDQKIEVAGQDELGRLAVGFDHMRRRLKHVQHAMEQSNQELELLNDLAVNASQMLNPQQVMDLALDTVVDRLGMQAGFIRLYDDVTGRFTLRAMRGVPPEQSEKIERRRAQAGADISKRAVENDRVIFVQDMSADPFFAEIWEERRGRSFVNIPLKSRGVAIGTLVLITRPDHPLQPQSLGFLQAVGNEIGIAIDNTLLLQETRLREQEARDLNQLATHISASLELSEVLQAVASGARKFMSADLGLVGLRDEDHAEIVIAAVAGDQAQALNNLSFPLDDPWDDCCLKNGHALLLHELSDEHGLYPLREPFAAAGVASLLTMPLSRGASIQGFILVASHTDRRFNQKEAQSLARLARQVFDAVENASLYKKVSYLAALEERERLAREMHDRLAQALGYINLKTAITEGMLRENKVAQAHSSLLELRQVSQSTYTDVREAIFNLRTVLASGLRFLPSLEEYVRDYRIHYGLDVQLSTNGVDLSRFPPDVDIQLLRIIQEALTNVRKHAQASRAWIRFVAEAGRVKIEIEDNGCGFDPRQATSDASAHYGLQIMRERVESVGGSFTIDAVPGQGTRIVIRVPLVDGESWSHSVGHSNDPI